MGINSPATQWIYLDNRQTFTVVPGPVRGNVPGSGILVTANYDSDSVSFIDVSTDVYGNNWRTSAMCSLLVAVGKHPASVTVLEDGPRYTANQAMCTVSIIVYCPALP